MQLLSLALKDTNCWFSAWMQAPQQVPLLMLRTQRPARELLRVWCDLVISMISAQFSPKGFYAQNGGGMAVGVSVGVVIGMWV